MTTSPGDRLRDLFIRMDCILTGKPEQDAVHMARNQSHFFDDPSSFLSSSGEYYLSDGGYSRLIFSEVSEEFRLTSNSRNAVKQVWQTRVVKNLAEEAARILIASLQDDVKDCKPRH